MKSLRYYLKALTPAYWLQNNPYSDVWDKKLNELLDAHTFTGRTEYTAKLGSCVVWVGNHPYASFSPYRPMADVRPKRSTVARAWEKLTNETLSEEQVLKRKLDQQTEAIRNIRVGSNVVDFPLSQ